MQQQQKPPVDWRAIERDYRSGVLTLRQIGEQHGVTHGAINKRAKRDGWDRDLSARIKAKAEALVSKQVVSNQETKEQKVSEKAVIEANAELQANIIVAHRKDIRKARDLVRKLFDEAEATTENMEIFGKLADLLDSNEEASRKRVEVLKRVLSLPSRVVSIERLVNALTKLVALERQAFGIDREEEKPKDPLEGMSEDQLAAEMQAIFARMRIVEGESVRV